MRLFYADPGLMSNTGHHANACRNLTAQFRSRGYEVKVYAAESITAELRVELDAQPLFRVDTYFRTTGDPICGWLTAFFLTANTMHEDLSTIPGIRPDDILFLASGAPGHLYGLTRWITERPHDDAPMTIMDFVLWSGLDRTVENGKETWSDRDPRQDPRATLFRFTGLYIQSMDPARLRFTCPTDEVARAHAFLLGRQVEVIPTFPFASPDLLTSRVGRSPITVGILGHQRLEKGFHFMPDVFNRLLHARRDIRILVHNSEPSAVPGAQDVLRKMAAVDRRLVLHEGGKDADAYNKLLAQCDLLLCPYDPNIYRDVLSGTAAEGLANAIPLVVPANTRLAAAVKEHGGGGTTFEGWDAPSIFEAAMRALDDFDTHAAVALVAADHWAEEEGPGKYVETILRVAGERG